MNPPNDQLRTPTATDSTPLLRATRESALYEPGEPVVFELSAPFSTPARWRLSDDGFETLAEGILAPGEREVRGSLSTPGFLRCTVEVEGAGPLHAAAGVAPEKIGPSAPEPEDFDAFWQTQRAKLAQVPLNVRTTPVPLADATLEAWDLQADSPGGPISGYLVRPAGAESGTLPAIILYHGAGVISARLELACEWAARGFLALDLNAHGVPNGHEEEYYAALRAGAFADFRVRGGGNREESYFLGMFLRAQRGMEVLAARPEWDGRNLISHGSSMGAGQAIAVAALEPRVSFLFAGVPALSDHTGFCASRISGWPGWHKLCSQAAALECGRYFDTVNFAPRIRQDAFFTVGFVDAVCPPTTVYAAYNRVAGRKAIFNDIPCAHANSPAAVERTREAVLAALR